MHKNCSFAVFAISILFFSSCVENYNPHRGLWAIHSSKASSPLTPPSMRSFHSTQAGYHFYKADFFNRRGKDSSNFSQGDAISEEIVIYPFANEESEPRTIFDYYPEGQLKLELKLEGGKEHAKVYHKNGNIRCEGLVENDLKQGLWNYYYDNGQKEEHINFKDDQMHGVSRAWFRDGKLMVEGNYSQNKKTGSWCTWDENGSKVVEGEFRNDLEDGFWTWYYSDGNRKQLGRWIKGLKEGKWQGWYEGGSKQFETSFRAGKQDGLSQHWAINGQKTFEANFKQGEVDGLVVHWYKNGVKEVECNYKEGEKDGVEKAWYRNGRLQFTRFCKDGRRISAKVFKPNGEQCTRSNLKDGNGVMIIYNDDGSEKEVFTYKNGIGIEG